MKKLNSIFNRLLVLCLSLMTSILSFAQYSGSGTGTKENPYLIFNAYQLNEVRYYNTACFKLMDDIDLTDFIADNNPKEGWVPISNFQGEFNGNGKAITGLMINRPRESFIGLFGQLTHALITSLHLDVNIIGGDYTGGLAGSFGTDNSVSRNSLVSGCYVRGKIVGNDNVGGLIGRCYARNQDSLSLRNSHNEADVSGKNDVGGIIGSFNSDTNYLKGVNITYCSNNSNIRGKTNVGGIVGYNKYAYVIFCASNANIYGAYDGDSVGGLCGYNYQVEISNSSFTGSICGYTNCGGIVGTCSSSVHINNCYANATIVCDRSVFGIGSAIVKNSFSLSTHIVALYPNGPLVRIGGIGMKQDNYALRTMQLTEEGDLLENIPDGDSNGTSIGAKMSKMKSIYIGNKWDFISDWAIQEGVSYPYLQWQTAPPVIETQTKAGVTTLRGTCPENGTVYVRVGDNIYKGNITSNSWEVTVPALPSGARVIVYAKSANKEYSNWVIQTAKYKGEGTEVNPYQIATAEDLANLCESGYYQLTNDIKLGGKRWTPIKYGLAGTITIDGAGHKITGLNTDNTKKEAGLFGVAYNVTIRNLIVETEEESIGSSKNSFTGILIGRGKKLDLFRCTAMGDANGDYNVGILIGLAKDSKISECYSKGNVIGPNHVGGLIGHADKCNISKCYSKANVTSTSSMSGYAGGLVGYGEGSTVVSDCCVESQVKAGSHGAGIVAYNNSGVITRCYATGDISAYVAAGVCGQNDGATASLSNSFAMTPKITGNRTGIRILGGIINGAPIPEKNNYALRTIIVKVNDKNQTIYDDPMQGYGKTTAELKLRSTYEACGWDFSKVWAIDENKSYPYLRCMKDYLPTDILQIPISKEGDKIQISIAREMLVITGSDKSLPVSIYNIAGTRVYQGVVNGSLSVSLPSGIYIVVAGKKKEKVIL